MPVQSQATTLTNNQLDPQEQISIESKRDFNIFIQEIAFQIAKWKMPSILFKPPYAKAFAFLSPNHHHPHHSVSMGKHTLWNDDISVLMLCGEKPCKFKRKFDLCLPC